MYRLWNLHNFNLLSAPSFSRSVCCLMFPCLDSCLHSKSVSQKKSPITNTPLLLNHECVILYARKLSYHGRQGRHIEDLVKEILRATKEVDVMTDSLHVTDVTDLVSQLHDQGFEAKRIERLLSRRLWLLKQPHQTSSLTQLLLSQTFPHSATCQLMEAIPYNLQNQLHQLPDRVNKMVQFFGKQGISEEDLWSVLSMNPKTLYLDLKTVETSVFRLKSIFSAKDVQKLIRKSPSVLVDPWPEVYHKYQYALFTMVYSNDDIVRSRLFSHSFEHIKNRHLFLQRAGLFTAVSPKLDPALNPNPRLGDVVDIPISTFLKRFPVANLQEYDSFCEMRAMEEGMEEEMNEYSDEEWEIDYSDSDSEGDILKKHPSAKISPQKKRMKKSKS